MDKNVYDYFIEKFREEWPYVRRKKASAKMWGGMFIELAQNIFNDFGYEGLEVIEKAIRANARDWAEYYGILMVNLYDKFGEKGLSLISNQWSKNAEKYIKNNFERFGVKDKGPKGFAIVYYLMDNIVGLKNEIVELTDKKAVNRFPFCAIFPQPNLGCPEVCIATSAFEKRAVEIINPRVKVSLTKMLTAGDPFCEVVWEIREE